jgi:calcineurin-like phosphoesterase family protein
MDGNMKTLNKDKPILFLGDHHGEWSYLLDIIDTKKISDCYLISVGDSGIGFTDTTRQIKMVNYLNFEFKERNIIFMGIRGNHDDPTYFQGTNRVALDNFELIEDYTIMEYNGKKIQFIGGATSIDRTSRRKDISYWEEEVINFNKDKCKEVDILITHTAPSWCFPQQFNEMVYGWAAEDAYLIEDLTDERAIMDEICKLCKPRLHLYGHFHSSWTEEINGCKHKLLDINEIWENVYV